MKARAGFVFAGALTVGYGLAVLDTRPADLLAIVAFGLACGVVGLALGLAVRVARG